MKNPSSNILWKKDRPGRAQILKLKRLLIIVMIENFIQQFIKDCKVVQDAKLESDYIDC